MPDVWAAVLGQIGAAIFLLSAFWFIQPILERWLDKMDRKEDE